VEVVTLRERAVRRALDLVNVFAAGDEQPTVFCEEQVFSLVDLVVNDGPRALAGKPLA
jgi:hypothetical protein